MLKDPGRVTLTTATLARSGVSCGPAASTVVGWDIFGHQMLWVVRIPTPMAVTSRNKPVFSSLSLLALLDRQSADPETRAAGRRKLGIRLPFFVFSTIGARFHLHIHPFSAVLDQKIGAHFGIIHVWQDLYGPAADAGLIGKTEH